RLAPGRVHLVENEKDIDALDLPDVPILVTNQTTMSQWDTAALMERVKERFPRAEVQNEICLATQLRQEAVAQQAKGCDLVIVVGDPRSNNTARLAQVAEEIAGVPARRVSDVTEVDIEWLKGIRKVGVTAGASTPTPITREVIAFLEQFDEHDPSTWRPVRTVRPDRLLPVARGEE
ncbi:MAG: 4-hydroxy-3-methylbut-2-enyl diphosphate reductase, partial [Alicyclobacillaceae bacterium]|nr:4-hydroxy-3-methylbut-2-enyl diphosphate reductase [Alicyclobacillaceae bacterium]